MIRGVIQRNTPSGLRSTFKRQANGATLDLNFMTGVMPAGVTFTRNSSTGYTDINGQAQTAGVNQPRFTTSGLMFNDAATAGALEKGLVTDMKLVQSGGPHLPGRVHRHHALGRDRP